MKLLPILLLIFFLPASAQEAPKGKRSCRIVFPERPNNAPKSAYLFDGKRSQRITLPSMNFSEVITLPAGEITIVMTTAEITDPELLPPNSPRLRITEDVRQFYILVSPDRSNATLPLKMDLVNAGSKFKPGETLWFNLTEHKISAKLGASTMSVDPKGRTVSGSPVSSSSYYKAEFFYQPQAEGRFYRITEQQWWHDVKSRHIGIVASTGGRLPKIYFYRDFR